MFTMKLVGSTMVLFMARFRSVYASDKYQCPCFSGTADDVYEPDSEAIWGAGARRRCGAEFVQGSATQKAPQGEDKKIRYQTGVGKITCQDEGCSAHQSKSVANRGPLILGTGHYYVCNGNPAHKICDHSYYLTKQHQDKLQNLTPEERKEVNDELASASPVSYQQRDTLWTLHVLDLYKTKRFSHLQDVLKSGWLDRPSTTDQFPLIDEYGNNLDDSQGEGPANVRRRLNVTHDTRRRPNVTERNLSHLLEKK